MPDISFLKEIALANIRMPKMPFKMNFAITYRCNYRCKMCNIWKKPKQNELSLKEIESIFSSAPFLRWLSLTGGEPFLNPDIDKIAKSASLFCKVSILNIPTNGSMPQRIFKKTKKICELAINKTIVTISLDDPASVHNEIRGAKDAWKNSLKTYSKLKCLEEEFKNFGVFFEFTLSPFNLNCFEKMIADAKAEVGANADDFYVTVFHVSKHFYNNKKMEHLKELFSQDIFNELKKIRTMLPAKFSSTNLANKLYLLLATPELSNPLPCRAASASCFLDPTGVLYACISMDKRIGDLRKSNYDLAKLMSSERADAIRDLVRNCSSCWTPCEANQTILANLPRACLLCLKSTLLDLLTH